MSSINGSFDKIGDISKSDHQNKLIAKKHSRGARYKIIPVDKQLYKIIDYINSHKSEIGNYEVVLEL